MTTERQQYNLTEENEEISLKDLILKALFLGRYLLSKWIIIILFGIIGSILGFMYSYFKKPIYTASTTFVLEEGDKGNGLGSLGGLASMAGIDLGGGGGLFQGDNIIELYKSRSMIQKALLTTVSVKDKKTLLIDWFIDFNDLKRKWAKTNWAKADFGDTSKFTVIQDSILREIVKDINKNYLIVSKPDKKLSKIQVDVKSKNELFAEIFSKQIVGAVNNFYVLTKTKRSSKNVAILQNKTDSVRAVMNGAIYAAVVITDETPNLNPTRQVQRVAPAQKAQFSAETNKAVLSEMVKNLEMAKMSLLKETPLIQIVDEPILPLEVDKVSKAKGIIIGAISFGFLSILWLLGKYFLREILN